MADRHTQHLLDLQAQMQAASPLPRLLTADEVTVFGAAIEAGAVVVPRQLREFLSGAAVWPIQFEGCSASVWSDEQWAQPLVAANRTKRDAFFARVKDGGLRALLERGAQRKAA